MSSSNAVLTVTGGSSSSNSCTPAPSGLIGLWRGDNNLNGSAGNNNGVAVGSISYAAGEVNAAFHYTNGSGYVQVPAAPSLNVGQGAGFTIEAWIQPADIQNEIPILEWQYNTNNGYSGSMFWISVQGAGGLYANLTESNNISHELTTLPGILTTNYQHVALTYDKASGVASIYRNGIIVASANLGSFTPNTSGNLLLGERTFLNGNPVFHYAGNLDEMSLYSRALSSNEIAAIYNAGANGKCPPVITPHSLINSQPMISMSVAGQRAGFVLADVGGRFRVAIGGQPDAAHPVDERPRYAPNEWRFYRSHTAVRRTTGILPALSAVRKIELSNAAPMKIRAAFLFFRAFSKYSTASQHNECS